jgi:hypothetical protein
MAAGEKVLVRLLASNFSGASLATVLFIARLDMF